MIVWTVARLLANVQDMGNIELWSCFCRFFRFWSGMAKSSIIILICYVPWYSVGLVEGTASCFDLWIKVPRFWQSSLSPVLIGGHAALGRSKVRSKSCWSSFTCTIRCQRKANEWLFSFRYLAGGWCLSFICTKPWKGASVNFLFCSLALRLSMFNASSSKI